MKFGAFTPQGWRLDLVGIDTSDHWSTMVDVTKTAESLGFTSAWVYDHFHTVPLPTQEATYEAWTLMAALAAVTDTIRLGQMCTCNGYRSPSYLAKVAASIDVISNGRLEMGIGGGWYEHEYKAYGYPFPKPSVRLGELDEAIQIMRMMWSEGEASFEGEHYTIDGAICQPKPIQDPMIPIWVAGGGERYTLATAARYADYTNFGGTLETFIQKSEVLEQHCVREGRDFASITRTANFNVLIGENTSQIDAAERAMRTRFATVLDDPDLAMNRLFGGIGSVVGTPDQIIEHLKAYEAAGMDYAIIYFAEAAYTTDGMDLFAREVMPAFV
ncbi:MAG: LLM class F420-dependent oxidoreductase [Actinomycetia bacterium]|nr:LLM class F420-dependent oxidoreductase [Actinomycetes bacterium]